jgi:hypothetical protein
MQSFNKYLTSFNHPRGIARIKVVTIEIHYITGHTQKLLQRISLCFPVAIARNTARLQLLPLYSWQPSQSFDTLECGFDKEVTRSSQEFIPKKSVLTFHVSNSAQFGTQKVPFLVPEKFPKRYPKSSPIVRILSEII